MQRIAQRSTEYPLPRECPTFDILTLAFETEPAILRKTAASVIAQDAPVWRWVICDNGSTSNGTREVLHDLARHPNIVVERLPRNLGIVEGHRRGLELCTADYVAFLDHDDVLTGDALRIVASYIDRFDHPGFLYSDEDKCDREDRRFAPLIKPDFSPALLSDTAYTCHLSVAQRALLAGCGAFADARVEGTQDWDLALRLFESGCEIVHVPEILYSWRTSASSTALTLSSKPYVIDAQRHCLQEHLRRRAVADRFEVVANPLFPEPGGYWWIRRRVGLPEPRVEEGDLVAFVPAGSPPLSPDWLREALGLLELVEDAGLVCAPHPDDPVDAHFTSCRRDATMVSAPWIARAAAIDAVGGRDVTEIELAIRLRSAGWRIIASPLLTEQLP